MNTPSTSFFRWASWVSLILPFLAYILCSEVSTQALYFSAPHHGHSVGALRHWVFSASAITGVLVLLVDFKFKQRQLFLLPLAGVILSYLFYLEAAWFTRFLE